MGFLGRVNSALTELFPSLLATPANNLSSLHSLFGSIFPRTHLSSTAIVIGVVTEFTFDSFEKSPDLSSDDRECQPVSLDVPCGNCDVAFSSATV